jgi:tRNA dimethylallyltransferase
MKDQVYELVAKIPKGRLMTYGQIAAICGHPRAARTVGQIAHWGPPELPWHRVVHKDGKLAKGFTDGGYVAHKRDLEAEGVKIDAEYKADIKRLLWQPPYQSQKLNVESQKLVVIVGETASGKSSLAHSMAVKFNGEIISADSWAVYRDFNIGTAKPTVAEQKEVKYHLIDVVDPIEGFSAAVFKQMASGAITDILHRSNLPIMVGGTGLYLDSVLFDFSFMPAGDLKLRTKLSSMSIKDLLTIINNKKLDLRGIDLRNKRRLVRLIESEGKLPTKNPLRKNTLVIGLKIPRAQLRENIKKRSELMFRSGLKYEVKELKERYGWEVEPMKGIGYREFKNYFESNQSLAETKRKIIKSTLDLAKRQRTWFKRNQQINWVETRSEAIEQVESFLKK